MDNRLQPRDGDPQFEYDSRTGGWTKRVTDPSEERTPAGRDSGLRKPTR